MLNITLPDGSVRQVEPGTTGYDLAASISEGLARNALAVKVNGEIPKPTKVCPLLPSSLSIDSSVEPREQWRIQSKRIVRRTDRREFRSAQ